MISCLFDVGSFFSCIQVFDAVKAVATSVLDGYNVCIFAYGQTGAGKTFTVCTFPLCLGDSGDGWRRVLFNAPQSGRATHQHISGIVPIQSPHSVLFSLCVLGESVPCYVINAS